MDKETKLQFRLAIHIFLVSAAVPAAILIAFGLRQILRELAWARSVDFGVDRILRARRPEFVLMGLGALLVLAGLVSVVRIAALCRRIKRLQGDPLSDAKRERAVVSPHGPGQDKYLRQLDEYLKNGIIDRAEYKVLKERHARR